MASKKNTGTPPPQLRLRVFAGPNGSGKSTVIDEIRHTEVNGSKVDLGFYINADIIAKALAASSFSFSPYKVRFNNNRFLKFAEGSGILNETFTALQLQALYTSTNTVISLYAKRQDDAEKIGQLLARFLREEMLRLRRRFSFETVFSHESNLDIMHRAAGQGYKVYLYYVGTESPEINKFRVEYRVTQGGHYVPPDTIEKRYYRSLGLMYSAAEISYQAYFFDNSVEGKPFKLAAHFKISGKKKLWDKISKTDKANWFKKYYKKPGK